MFQRYMVCLWHYCRWSHWCDFPSHWMIDVNANVIVCNISLLSKSPGDPIRSLDSFTYSCPGQYQGNWMRNPSSGFIQLLAVYIYRATQHLGTLTPSRMVRWWCIVNTKMQYPCAMHIIRYKKCQSIPTVLQFFFE